LKLGVEYHRDPGARREPADQPVVERILAGADRLQPGGAVHVVTSENLRSAVGPHRLDQQHERVALVALEPVGAVLVQHAGRERAEGIPALARALMKSFISARRESARMDRAPSARGPTSARGLGTSR